MLISIDMPVNGMQKQLEAAGRCSSGGSTVGQEQDKCKLKATADEL